MSCTDLLAFHIHYLLIIYLFSFLLSITPVIFIYLINYSSIFLFLSLTVHLFILILHFKVKFESTSTKAICKNFKTFIESVSLNFICFLCNFASFKVLSVHYLKIIFIISEPSRVIPLFSIEIASLMRLMHFVLFRWILQLSIPIIELVYDFNSITF